MLRKMVRPDAKGRITLGHLADSSLNGANGEEIFEAYAENNTPAAYRIFWYYGPNKKEITILATTPHP